MSETQSIPFVYIAGPMSGIDEYNAPAFHAAQSYFEAMDLPRENIFNPIISEESVMVQNGLLHGQEAYRVCLRADLDWICDHATTMYMLKGWENSPGARTEHALACALKIDILYQA